MKSTVNDFFKGAFFLIGLFLILAHYTGFAAGVKSITGFTTGTFRTLQGR